MQRTWRFLVLAASIGVVAMGCASTTPSAPVTPADKTTTVLTETATLLSGVGDTFAQAAKSFKVGCDGTPRTITPAMCESFRQFGLKFQAAYPLAISSFKTAANANDTAAAANAAATINQLSVDLTALVAQGLSTFGPKQ